MVTDDVMMAVIMQRYEVMYTKIGLVDTQNRHEEQEMNEGER